MANREFKQMVLETLTGIEKRVDDLKETLYKEIKYKKEWGA